MICIRFEDDEAKRQALMWLIGRFSFKTFKSGELLIPEEALTALAHQRIRFTVQGPATYEQLLPGPALQAV